jgi:hypothetical protein
MGPGEFGGIGFDMANAQIFISWTPGINEGHVFGSVPCNLSEHVQIEVPVTVVDEEGVEGTEIQHATQTIDTNQACCRMHWPLTVGVEATDQTMMVGPEGTNNIENAGNVLVWAVPPGTTCGPDFVADDLPTQVITFVPHGGAYALIVHLNGEFHTWAHAVDGAHLSDILGTPLMEGRQLVAFHGGDVHVTCREVECIPGGAIPLIPPPPFPQVAGQVPRLGTITFPHAVLGICQ